MLIKGGEQMKKKGISPLIATVLLIGFTIVLAAVVMRWGGEFVRTTTEETACETDIASACIDTRVSLESAEDSGETVNVVITSNSDQTIDGFRIVLWEGTITIATEEPQPIDGELTPYNSLSYQVTYSDNPDIVDGIDKVEVFPVITIGDCPSGACTESGAEGTVTYSPPG